MDKEFVPYELAVKLKALGFDEPCFGCYTKDGELSYDFSDNRGEGHYFQDCSAPTFSQTFRWFREKRDLNPSIMYNGVGQWDYTLGGVWSGRIWDSYEEAELACLEKLIEIVEPKSK